MSGLDQKIHKKKLQNNTNRLLLKQSRKDFPRVIAQGEICEDCNTFTRYNGEGNIIKHCKCGKDNDIL